MRSGYCYEERFAKGSSSKGEGLWIELSCKGTAFVIPEIRYHRETNSINTRMRRIRTQKLVVFSVIGTPSFGEVLEECIDNVCFYF